MARLQLYELRIIEFKKIQQEVFRWNRDVLVDDTDFHIIGVRDFTGKQWGQ